MGRLGLDYATLAANHPGLIYASISGYGQTGPSGPKGGFDLVAQGVSGLMSITGHPDGEASKVGVALVDVIASEEQVIPLAPVGDVLAYHSSGRPDGGRALDAEVLKRHGTPALEPAQPTGEAARGAGRRPWPPRRAPP